MTAAMLYAAAYVLGWLLLVWRRPERRPPRLARWAIGLVVLVAAGWVAQLMRPSLLAEGMREPAAVRAGQWWRLLTAIVLQDGGWQGAVFNLVTLAVTVGLAAEVLTPKVGVGAFIGCGVVANLVTVLTFGQSGAGSSMATMALLAVAVVVGLRNPSWREVGLVVLLVVVAVLLLLRRDQHGIALTVGLLGGLALRRRRRQGTGA